MAIALLLIGIPLVLSGDFQFGGPLVVSGLTVLIGSIWFYRLWPKSLEPEWESFRASGDYDVWPFFRQSDFDQAKETCHLLGLTAVHE